MSIADDARKALAEITPGEWKHGQWQYEIRDGRLVYTEIRPSNDEDASITVAISPDEAQKTSNHKNVIGGCGCCGSPFGNAADARFIAAAPGLVRALLAEIDRLTQEKP